MLHDHALLRALHRVAAGTVVLRGEMRVCTPGALSAKR